LLEASAVTRLISFGIGIAKHDVVRSGFLRRLPGRQGILGLVFKTVKSVFRIVDDRSAVSLEESDALGDHCQVLSRGGAQHFGDVQQPAFADDGDDRCFRFEQLPHQLILFHTQTLAARHAERGQTGVLEPAAPGAHEEFHVFGVRAGPAAFNVLNPEGVELFGDAQFVHHRKIDAFALAAVAQGRIVYLDFGFHSDIRVCGKPNLSERNSVMQISKQYRSSSTLEGIALSMLHFGQRRSAALHGSSSSSSPSGLSTWEDDEEHGKDEDVRLFHFSSVHRSGKLSARWA
jgi:hypothetical protein